VFPEKISAKKGEALTPPRFLVIVKRLRKNTLSVCLNGASVGEARLGLIGLS